MREYVRTWIVTGLSLIAGGLIGESFYLFRKERPIETICPISGQRLTIYEGSVEKPRIYRYGGEGGAVIYSDLEDFMGMKQITFIDGRSSLIDSKTKNAVYFGH